MSQYLGYIHPFECNFGKKKLVGFTSSYLFSSICPDNACRHLPAWEIEFGLGPTITVVAKKTRFKPIAAWLAR